MWLTGASSVSGVRSHPPPQSSYGVCRSSTQTPPPRCHPPQISCADAAGTAVKVQTSTGRLPSESVFPERRRENGEEVQPVEGERLRVLTALKGEVTCLQRFVQRKAKLTKLQDQQRLCCAFSFKLSASFFKFPSKRMSLFFFWS